MGPKWDQ